MKRLTRKQIEELSAKISKQYAIQPPIDHEMLENLVKNTCLLALNSHSFGTTNLTYKNIHISINSRFYLGRGRKKLALIKATFIFMFPKTIQNNQQTIRSLIL